MIQNGILRVRYALCVVNATTNTHWYGTGNDTVHIVQQIESEQVTLGRQGNDVVIILNETGETMRLAAEAFLKNEQTGEASYSAQRLIDALVAGNGHASKFTKISATAFSEQWVVGQRKIRRADMRNDRSQENTSAKRAAEQSEGNRGSNAARSDRVRILRR